MTVVTQLASFLAYNNISFRQELATGGAKSRPETPAT
jgi:hypothetical protein